jgi:hypothetical protein
MSAFQIKPRALATGLASFVPGVVRLMNRGSGGTGSTRYCYAVWLRHLVKAAASGIPTNHTCVAELGPGDSLGIGLAAVLSGTDCYVALDVKAHANPTRNLELFDELVALFRERAPIPGDDEFPLARPRLADYSFPSQILSGERLSASLADSRIEDIRAAILGEPSPITVTYRAPWKDPSIVRAGSVDFLFSQAVLEHVEELEDTYRAMREWLRPGGYMSHSVDFSSHDLTRSWNGHWTLSDAEWRIVRGTRPYLINRQPLSRHLGLLAKYRFDIVALEKQRVPLDKMFRPARQFHPMDPEDAQTPGVFIQARAA